MRTLIITLFAVTFVFFGCNETKRVIDGAANIQLSGAYNITNAGDMQVSNPDIQINFSALDRSFRGNGGCNSFFGNYTLDLYALSFNDIAATEKYCDEAIMTTENEIMEALRNTGSYSYENSILTLYSKTDRSVLLTAKKENREN